MIRIKPIKKITYVQLVLLHVAMAFIIYQAEVTSKFFLFAAIVYFLYRIFSNANKKDEVLLGAAYVMGFEVFSRMTGGAFTYEFAKYTVIVFLTIGMFFKGFNRASWPYAFYILFLIPGILFSAINLNYDTNVGNAIGFNLSGPVCLGISALYCYDRKMPPERLQGILLSALLPIISITIYLFLYTPNIRDALSGTQSNFETSGGFGPNQVATILGLGAFILFSRLFIIKDRLVNFIDLGLFVIISYRAIVTFSRGGVVTAAVCALVFLLIFYFKSEMREKATLIPKIVFVGIVAVAVWLFTSAATLGLIDKRYSNQDAAGRVKKDITTGRTDLIAAELDGFIEFPLTGVGVGKIKEYREKKTGTEAATHNEVSRILSEHGLFGLFALLILIGAPLILRMKPKKNIYFFSFFIFWILTINHSSMRIAAPALLYGLSLITLIDAKRKSAIPGQ